METPAPVTREPGIGPHGQPSPGLWHFLSAIPRALASVTSAIAPLPRHSAMGGEQGFGKKAIFQIVSRKHI